MKKLMLILIVMAGLITGCNGGGTPETPEEIAKAYIEAVLKGNLDEANSYFSKQTKNYTKEHLYRRVGEFNHLVKDNTKFKYMIKVRESTKKKNFQQIEVYMLNETAKGKEFREYLKEYDGFTGKYTDKITSNIDFDFVFENGKWKLRA